MCRLVDVQTNYGEMVRVAEIKRDSIMNIIEAAEGCDKIDEIILFGSSLEERCSEQSDIDIAVISNAKRAKLFNSRAYNEFIRKMYRYRMGQDYDILQFNSIDDIWNSKDAVCFDIKHAGKTIYRRV